MTSDSSSVEQEEHQKILGRVWQLWNPSVLVRLTQSSCVWGLTFVPHCRTGTQPLSFEGSFSKGKNSDVALGSTAPRPKDQQRAAHALIRRSFYICQELDEQGKECASSPLELQVTGSVPAPAWPPAPVTCLFFQRPLKIQGIHRSNGEAAAGYLQGEEPAPNVYPL